MIALISLANRRSKGVKRCANNIFSQFSDANVINNRLKSLPKLFLCEYYHRLFGFIRTKHNKILLTQCNNGTPSVFGIRAARFLGFPKFVNFILKISSAIFVIQT